MPDSAKSVSLMEEIEQLSGYRFYFEDFKALDLSLYIFGVNFKELHDLIMYITTDPQAARLFTVVNEEKRHAVGYDIVRRIHNFVASVKSLLDHTRNTYNKLYKNTGLFPDYQQRKDKDFANDSQSKFVQELREYAQHYKAPIISFITTLHTDGPPTIQVTIPLAELRKFSWNAKAAEHLATLANDMNVLEEMTIYRDKVITFYEWFGSRQKEIHADELKEFDDKRKEFNHLMKQ